MRWLVVLVFALTPAGLGCAFDEAGVAGEVDPPDPPDPPAGPDAGELVPDPATAPDAAVDEPDEPDDDDDDDLLPFGARCEEGDDCAGGFCERMGRHDVCTMLCARDLDCPDDSRGCKEGHCEP